MEQDAATDPPDLPFERRLATRHLAARRLAAAAVVGVVVGVGCELFLPWQASVLLGWCAAAGAFLVRVWMTLLRMDAAFTARHATREDDSRFAADVSVLASSVSSLLAVGLILVKAHQRGGAVEAIFTAAAVLGVVLSWSVVHTVFALRYASLYYENQGSPVVGFPDSDAPCYADFAYLAFTIGMTYQVSDTELRGRAIRSAALRHALLSYVFGTAIIAMTINVVAGLVR